MENTSTEHKDSRTKMDIVDILTEVFRAMIDGALLLDTEGVCVFANQQYARMFGLEQKDFLGKQIMDFPGIEHQKPEEMEKFMPLFTEAVKKGRAGPVDLTIVAMNGEEISVSVAGGTLKDAEGNPTHVIVVIRDISERVKMEQELVMHRTHLEELVQKRADQLVKKNKQLLHEIDERLQVEKALRESEQLFKTIVETAPSLLTFVDSKGTNIYVSPNCKEITGYSPEEQKGRMVWWVHEDDMQKAEETFDRALRDGTGGKNFEYKAVKKDGELWFASSSWKPLKDEEGRLRFIVLQTVDVTERIRMEEERKKLLHNLENRIRELHCLYGIDEAARTPDLTIERFLGEAVQLVPRGWQYPEITGSCIFLEGKKYATKNFRETERLINANIVVNGTKSGLVQVCYLEEKPENDVGPFLKEERNLLNAIAERIGFVIEQKRAQTALMENEARYRELTDSITDVFFAMDKDLRYTYWNRASEELLGIEEKDAIGKSLYELFPDVPQTKRAEKIYREVMRTQKPQTFVSEYSKGEVIYHFEISAYPSRDGISVFTRDITRRVEAEEKLREYSEELQKMVEERTRELQEAQEELIRKEKLATLGQLAGSVGHEIRNPLGIIRNSAYFLTMKLRDGDEQIRKHLLIIEKNVQRVNKIVTDLMDFSSTKKPSLVVSDVDTIVKNSLTAAEIPETIAVRTQFDENTPPTLLDPDQIQQAFLNIIQNAVQAMPEGGRLEIATEAEDDSICIRFKDTGKGIPEENLQKIFDPLFTTKAKGIGLGLVVVKDIVNGHGGRIEAHSKVGEGTTFTIKLPFGRKAN